MAEDTSASPPAAPMADAFGRRAVLILVIFCGAALLFIVGYLMFLAYSVANALQMGVHGAIHYFGNTAQSVPKTAN